MIMPIANSYTLCYRIPFPYLIRMETTGQPMKIHISMETKLLLDTLGRFFTEHRGLVDVKGKVVAVLLHPNGYF